MQKPIENNNKVSYWGEIAWTVRTLITGLKFTLRHLKRATFRRPTINSADKTYFSQPDGLVTVQYPDEQMPTPEVGRYRLHMETPDCIVCDQCARICPVDCIKIEKIKAADVIGTTSDGSKVRFYLPTFDIDMAKCCFCGLCTVVCPTECLIMTPVYDYSTQNRQDLIYSFGNLSPEEARQKEAEIAEIEAARKAAKAAALKAAPPKNNPTQN